MIFFHKFENLKPAIGEQILIKIKKSDPVKYYVVKRVVDYVEGCSMYEEAGGEEYAAWKEEDLEGWCSLLEIERNEKWN